MASVVFSFSICSNFVIPGIFVLDPVVNLVRGIWSFRSLRRNIWGTVGDD